MIILRYLAKEIYTTLIAVTGILLLIFLSNQFVRYLSEVAAGKFAVAMITKLMVIQIPHLLGLLLPLGLFLGILLSFGRLYADGEMTILSACGVSRIKLSRMTMCLALLITVIVASLSLWLSPQFAAYNNLLLAQAKAAPVIDIIMPGRFLASSDGRRIYYVENISRDHQSLKNIFVAEQPAENSHGASNWSVISAALGYQSINPAQGGIHQLVVEDGYRYQGTAGNNEYRILRFGKTILRLEEPPAYARKDQDAKPTSALWRSGMKNRLNIAELQWRISLPLSVLLLTFLAIPLSRVQPRKGKYSQLFPSILIYIFYANMLFVARAWIESGKINPMLGLWWLHALLFLLATTIWMVQSGVSRSLLHKFFSVRSSA